MISDIKQAKRDGNKTIQIVLVKRHELVQRENSQRHWISFNQHKVIYDQPQEVVPAKINKLIKSKFKPDIPIHMGQTYKSRFCSDHRSSIFEQYDKMRDSVSLSKPFLKETLPPSSLILNSRLAFAVKLTGLQDYYELPSRLCAN